MNTLVGFNSRRRVALADLLEDTTKYCVTYSVQECTWRVLSDTKAPPRKKKKQAFLVI